MARRRSFLMATVIAVFLSVIAVVASAQADRRAATLDDLLIEIRGLRADLGQAASASMRMQLLVARLSLQEQRITVLSRQLTDVQSQLGTAVRERTHDEETLQDVEHLITTG